MDTCRIDPCRSEIRQAHGRGPPDRARLTSTRPDIDRTGHRPDRTSTRPDIDQTGHRQERPCTRRAIRTAERFQDTRSRRAARRRSPGIRPRNGWHRRWRSATRCGHSLRQSTTETSPVRLGCDSIGVRCRWIVRVADHQDGASGWFVPQSCVVVGCSLHPQIAFMLAEFSRRDGLAVNAVGLTSFTGFIVQMILRGIPHNYSEQLAHGRHGGAGPGYLRRAEAFMRAHAASPLRLDQIAAAGCSVRTLSLVFRRFRATTPLAALHTVRLEAVRAELLDRTNTAPTSEIARRYGFSHPGRFIRAYQQRFGQTPPAPLRRSAVC